MKIMDVKKRRDKFIIDWWLTLLWIAVISGGFVGWTLGLFFVSHYLKH